MALDCSSEPKITRGSDDVMACEMLIKDGQFVGLPWQNFKVGNL